VVLAYLIGHLKRSPFDAIGDFISSADSGRAGIIAADMRKINTTHLDLTITKQLKPSTNGIQIYFYKKKE
jgi:hypothetical protein